ncbi:CXXC motif containing zinc binding protein-like isoform X2 [Eriocheir sinensis]|uniref:CXXC motif containing zinc binding protein-like isoform X2 n=1 Tax=Eriocheir sinensis TaxID=95602 RepID=UPI0021CA4861|nr:CXXC motif containing zinc binding protein-like isoform X2 [Eriocheir sinensis]
MTFSTASRIDSPPPRQTKCGSCGEVSEKWQYVAVDEVVAVPHSRGSCNMLVKCKLCGRTNTLDVLADKKKTYTMEDVPSFKVIIAFECRGLSVVDFQFGKGWQCQGVDSRTPFTDLDLDEEWCDYDEEANLPVGITELEYKVT